MLGTFRAGGEIDLATAPALRTGIRAAIDVSDETLVAVECSGVTFMDSAGYHVLADATRYAVRRGHMLVIRNPSVVCAKLLGMCDADRELHVDNGRAIRSPMRTGPVPVHA